MSIVVECKSCRKKQKAPPTLAGKRVRCKCGNVIAIPVEAPPATPSELDLSDVSLMSHGDTVAAPSSCPSCMMVMLEGAILCLNCGFNKQTGQRVGGESAVTATDADSSALKRKKVEAKPPPAWVGSLVKLVIFLVVAGGVGYGTFHMIQAVTFDPTKQREADMLLISPRMKVEDVVKALGGPPREILTERDPSTSDNVVKYVPKKLFWSDDFMTKYSEKDLQYGFTFVYRYTDREHLYIWFNSDGEVEYMEKHDPLQLLFGG